MHTRPFAHAFAEAATTKHAFRRCDKYPPFTPSCFAHSRVHLTVRGTRWYQISTFQINHRLICGASVDGSNFSPAVPCSTLARAAAS